MHKKALVIVNTLLLVAFISAVTAMLIYREIPSPWQGSYWSYLMHIWSGRTIVVLVLAHLWLNRKWFKANYKWKRKQPKEDA